MRHPRRIGSLALVLALTFCTRTLEKKQVVPEPARAKVEVLQSRADEVAVPQSAITGGIVGGIAAAPPLERDRAMNTEEYGRIAENGFHRAADQPLSTFSIDVDRASYSNVRRFLAGGQLPPRDAVRIEEMINYFPYDYPQPSGADPFAVVTELGSCPWNPADRLLRIGIQGRSIDLGKGPASNLVFLLDVSGSMDEANKLPLLKSALSLLVEQLRAEDRVAIVVYAGAAGLVLPSTAGSNKAEILNAIGRLQAGGSTAGAEGIVLAYRIAKENYLPRGNNRVILATDGDFNVGVTSDGELERLIEAKRAEGIALTVLGFGTGNIKDSKMELLADKGNGNYAYIDSLLEAKKTLVSEAGGTLFTIAKDVKIQVEFNPARIEAYRLIGYENRLLAAEDFNDDRKDAGEIGAGHSVTALYEIVPPGGAVRAGSVDTPKYGKRTAGDPQSDELLTVKIRYKDPDGDASRLIAHAVTEGQTAISDDFRFAAAVAEMGMLLRKSEHRGNASWLEVIRMAAESAGRDTEGYRAEFVRLAQAARALDAKQVAVN